MEDRRILQLLFARAEQALEELAKKYGNGLLRLCRNILGNNENAQECVNDTYLALWNAIPPARPDPLSAYIYRVSRNIALKRLRQETAQKRGGGYGVSLDELCGCVADRRASDMLDAWLLGQAISAFLAEESRENRVLFLRRYWFGDSIRDAAQAVGLSENTASVRLSRIRNKLRDYLIREGYYL